MNWPLLCYCNCFHSPKNTPERSGEKIIKELMWIQISFQINFSSLARKYGLSEKTKTGNMVVKEFLENNGVQLCRFNQFRNGKSAARRRLRRMQGGEITVPIQQTNREIRETLMVSCGEEPNKFCSQKTQVKLNNKK